jgi:3-dehydroquinate synthase
LEKIVINTPVAVSEIRVGENWENVKSLLPGSGVVIISDSNVRRIYSKNFPAFPVIEIDPGEGSKTLDTIESLSLKLLDAGLDRSGFILAIGGGVVSDLAGFLAAIYMRGIRCGYVSTTLLSQVDASTGGKTGVDLGCYKNILGVIRQPEFVICDPEMLQTLPEEEYLSGLAEMIKTAIIGDTELFDLIEKNVELIMKRDKQLLENLVSRCVRFKADVVSKDEKESGLRRILNFGHTFGHAIELEKSIRHGFAVAAGMKLSTLYSYEQQLCSTEDKDRIITLIDRFNLGHDYNDIPFSDMENLIRHDKKKTGEAIDFVFTNGIGKALYRKVPVTEIMEFYKKVIVRK